METYFEKYLLRCILLIWMGSLVDGISFLSSNDGRQLEAGCPLWETEDGQIVAGRYYRTGESVGGSDLLVPFHLHNRWAWKNWIRFHYFWESSPFSPEELMFAPGFDHFLGCHSLLANVHMDNPVLAHAITTTNSTSSSNAGSSILQRGPLTASLQSVPGEVLFTNCRHADLSRIDDIRDLPEPSEINWTSSVCADTIHVASSLLPNAGMGAFSNFAVSKGAPVAFSPAIHMLRSELRNQTSGQDELLLNYCYSHPQTPLLLLPRGPGVNYINHNAERANVALRWNNPESAEDFFVEPTQLLFGTFEDSEINLVWTALSDISPGEELYMDYGRDWEEAWSTFVNSCSGESAVIRDCPHTFRWPIGVPDDFFPTDWLEQELMEDEWKKYTWATPTLQLGQVEQIRVAETGETPGAYLHRVGLGKDLARKMKHYADETGITSLLKQYVVDGKPLSVGGDAYHRINGGRWWVKRFGGEWQSNMHYITPDDARSNEDFLAALGEAGFDKVLEAVGKHFDLDGLLCFYPSFIAVQHSVGSLLHSDAFGSGGRLFNMIFPVLQANGSLPELVLGEDSIVDEFGEEDNSYVELTIPYRYEYDHAILLGDAGQHATAPCDYRATGEFRLAISVYMGDVNQKNIDSVLWGESSQPLYPPFEVRKDYLLENAGTHWNAKNTKICLPNRATAYS